MIKILDEYETNFINFLNEKKFTNEVVKLSVLHGYDSLESVESGNGGFAVYLPELRVIMLPTENPEELEDYKEFVIHNLAHEYKHFLQDLNNNEFNEEEADKFADEMVEEYLRWCNNENN